MPDKPNVLFILTDQWRGSALGVSDDSGVCTPHLDALAARGVNCPRAYAANPVCTPNRATILTGRHAHQTGMIRNDLMLPPDEVCFPEVFRRNGFTTHYIGKFHIDGEARPGYIPPGWRRRGFQTFEGFNRGHVYHRHWGFDDAGKDLPWNLGGDPFFEPTLQAELAMRFMTRNQGRPFLCFLSLGPPHNPFIPSPAFDHYSPDSILLRPNVPSSHQVEARQALAGYYGLCEALDHEIGRLLNFLEESGLARDTLVVFTSDHGELAGSHGKMHKGEPEEESLRVPLILHWPGVLEGGRTNPSLINSIDIMPTLLGLVGLPDPGTGSGANLAPLLTGEDNAVENACLACQGKLAQPAEEQWRCLVTPTHKLVIGGADARSISLYHLGNDPFELDNLVGKQPALEKSLRETLLQKLAETGDPFPGPATSAQFAYPDLTGPDSSPDR